MTFSIRMRLTLWYSAMMVATLVAFSAGVLWLHAEWSRVQFDSELLSIGNAMSRMLEEEIEESHSLAKAVSETGTAMNVAGRGTAILDPTGKTMIAHWNGFTFDAKTVALDRSSPPRFTTTTQTGGAWRTFSRRESSEDGDYILLVAGPLDQLARQRVLLTRVLLVAAPLIVLAGAGISWWVASSALRPVTTMAAQAETITAQSANWRLAAPAADDELGQLARAFNRLLDRLGQALQMQRQFMADASHELRTPVSVIQTAAEVTLDRLEREAAEYREALTIVGEQSTRLSRMVDDMLVLARADAGGYPLTRSAVYLDDIVAECVRAVSVVAAARHVHVVSELQRDVALSADDSLLRRLVMNLLDNAVQYSPEGGWVTVAVSRDETTACLSVSDTGVGIPAADRERVFERFVRLDPARSTTAGAGLGLSIARWIAEQHHGTLQVESNAVGGCIFVARLPLSADAAIPRDRPN